GRLPLGAGASDVVADLLHAARSRSRIAACRSGTRGRPGPAGPRRHPLRPAGQPDVHAAEPGPVAGGAGGTALGAGDHRAARAAQRTAGVGRRALLLGGPLGRGDGRAGDGHRGRPGDLVLRAARARSCGAAAARGGRGRAADHLDAAAVHAPETRSERESFDFLLVAQALAAEQAGEPQRALAILSPILNVGYAQMMLRHQWLPGIARLARRIGDEEAARAALAACEYEADREKVPARAHAALQWCRALIDRDVAAGKAVVAHHRAAGRQVELAWALEDLAEIHAETGRPDDAGRCLSEAVEIYGDLSARWDRHRAQQ